MGFFKQEKGKLPALVGNEGPQTILKIDTFSIFPLSQEKLVFIVISV